ncbi:hypothetical protein GQ44DRAFT_739261 [Phaeosphaeriaceae sp. PMI808]|nr:hypothetical protein GQ44DRAFT_739261 [Phaeosphaeriaceae sp. PMI808]
MRLLLRSDSGELSLTKDFISDDTIPPYAILSHTWEDGEEVTFRDLIDGTGKNKASYNKIHSAELQEAINSMFRWYQNSQRCYEYLSNILYSTSNRDDECLPRWKPAFKKSRWFTLSVEFFSKESAYLGSKQSLEQTVHEIIGIAIEALRRSPLSQFSKDKRLLWAEDKVYCLLGIFNIYILLIYSKGRNSVLARLQEQVEKISKNKVLSLDNG